MAFEEVFFFLIINPESSGRTGFFKFLKGEIGCTRLSFKSSLNFSRQLDDLFMGVKSIQGPFFMVSFVHCSGRR